MTYSDHGPAHSQSIIDVINLILGEHRVILMGATDTWMILECAYLHDMGMYVPAQEIKDYVESKKYEELLNKLKNSINEEERQNAQLLSGEKIYVKKNGVKYIADLLLRGQEALVQVLQKHFREIHAERSAQYILWNTNDNNPLSGKDLDVQMRLWKIIASVCKAHEWERDDIINELNQFEKGFGIDTIHPRFIAELIRLGDLLDLDNNRFNTYQIDLYGAKLPSQSQAHKLKHDSLTHLYVSPEEIHVEVTFDMKDYADDYVLGFVLPENKAEYENTVRKLSKDLSKENIYNYYLKNKKRLYISGILKILSEKDWNMRDELITRRETRKERKEHAEILHNACEAASNWFDWIEEEIKFFAVNWLDIIPKGFCGSIPRLRDAKVFWQGRILDKETIRLKYNITHERAVDIILGTGLYGNLSEKGRKNITWNEQYVFLREFLQNAVDATKIQLYCCLRQCGYGNAINFGNKTADWHPIKVMQAIGDYIKNLKVELRIYYNTSREDRDATKNNELENRLIIVVRDVGTGIDLETLRYMSKIGSQNESLKEDTADIPEWLRPNGSFGIGMQSVFGIVNEFNAISGSRKDHVQRDIYFKSAKSGGSLFAVEHNGKKKFNQMIKYGTKIIIQLSDTHIKKMGLPNKDPERIFNVILEQINEMIGEDIIPVDIRFFVDDIEILFQNINSEKSNGKIEYSPVKKFKPLFKDLADNIIETDKINIHYQFERENGKNKLNLIGYDKNKKIYMEMNPKNIKDTDVLDLKVTGTKFLYPVDFFYRGMRVPHVQASSQIEYPCWEIRAYGYFGNAEDYLEINRNKLLAEKETEVFMKVSECIDDILFEFWRKLYGDGEKTNEIIACLSEEQINGLTISLIYQQIISLYTKDNKDFISQSGGILNKLISNSTCMIQTLHYEYGILIPDVMSVKNVFADNLFEIWFLRAEDINSYNIEVEKTFDEFEDKSTVIVEDIFTDYLLKRKFEVKITKLGAVVFTQPDVGLCIAYKFNKGNSTGIYISDKTGDVWIENLFNYVLPFQRKEVENCEEIYDCDLYIVIPAFERYAELAVDILPEKDDKTRNLPFCPNYLKVAGNYFILPFTYEEINNWKNENAEEKNNIKERIIGKIKEYGVKELDFYKQNQTEAQILQYVAEKRNMEIEEVREKYCDVIEDFFVRIERALNSYV